MIVNRKLPIIFSRRVFVAAKKELLVEKIKKLWSKGKQEAIILKAVELVLLLVL